MYKKIIICFIIFFSLSLIPLYAETPTLPYKIKKIAPQNDFVLQKVIDCESGGKVDAYNPKDTDGYPKYGILQFHLPTFIAWAKAAEIDEPDVWNPEQQISLYKWAAKNGKLRSWGCFVRMFP